MKFATQLPSILVLSALSVFIIQCRKEESHSNNEQTGEVAAVKSGDAAKGQVEVQDYPKLYCENVEKLKLRADVKEELAFFCKSGKPTADFLKYRKQAIDSESGKYQLDLLQAQHSTDSDKSEFLLVWSFKIPIRPIDIKGKPIYDFVTNGFTTDTITSKGSAAKRNDDPLDSGLHLWSADMSYDLTIKGTQGLSLVSQRKTQYNLYQVQSGNEEMGLGVEHLVDTNNPNYTKSTMLNFSFNDGSKLNDGKGQAIVVSLLHFVLSNQGFPATATKSIQEIAQHTADGMYNGLSH
ncbi:MAG: hypothetical protein NTX25_02805 [Proteobacteria bacterium]|nr:hypothetical protein [Pseudomonadota bacterium]